MVGIIASEKGREKAINAYKLIKKYRKNVNQGFVVDRIGCQSRTVVSHFFNRIPIREDNFISICEFLGLEWTEICEQHQEESTQKINSGRLSKSIELKNKNSVVTIASLADVLCWGWSGNDLLESLIELDYETISGLTDDNEGHIEQWVPVFMDHPDTWRLLIDGSEKIVGYWHFVALFDKEYQLAKKGMLLDSEITCDKVCHLEVPGFYNIYFVLFSILPKYRGVHNFQLLLNSLMDRFTDLAKKNIFFKELCVNAFTNHGMSLCKTLDMNFICNHTDVGKVFVSSFYPLPDLEIFNDYPDLVRLYSNRFGSSV